MNVLKQQRIKSFISNVPQRTYVRMKFRNESLSADYHKLLKEYKLKHNIKEKCTMERLAKRTFDVAVASASLLFAGPVILLSMALIKTESKGPALFKQIRLGKDGKPFVMYKLRTMDINKNGGHVTLVNDERITRIGKFLRRRSFDELPQLINIIKGDMSLVGPRPMPRSNNEELIALNPERVGRLAVKPGAQLNYKKAQAAGSVEGFAAEDRYVKTQGLLTDLQHLRAIVKRMLTGDNY